LFGTNSRVRQWFFREEIGYLFHQLQKTGRGSATVERPFAEALDRDDEVKLFFKIETRMNFESFGHIKIVRPSFSMMLAISLKMYHLS